MEQTKLTIGVHWSPLELEIWNGIDLAYHWSPLESIGVEDSIWSLMESIGVGGVDGVGGVGGVGGVCT